MPPARNAVYLVDCVGALPCLDGREIVEAFVFCHCRQLAVRYFVGRPAKHQIEPVLTPYLVLHAENGNPTALINLENQMITDYSLAPSVIKDSDSEHKELISEFRSELQEALIEGGWEQFAAGLVIPAIPLILSNKLGFNEIQKFLDLIPTRG